MARKHKTSKHNRINFTYYSVDGTRITLRPGENGVTEADINLLHRMDDDEFNNDRRESSTERFSPLEDWLLENENTQSPVQLEKTVLRDLTAEDLRRAIDTLLPSQKKLLFEVYFRGLKVAEIARAEGVDESSVRDRLKRIYKKLKKFNG